MNPRTLIACLSVVTLSCLLHRGTKANSSSSEHLSPNAHSVNAPYQDNDMPVLTKCENGNQSFSPSMGTVVCDAIDLNFFAILCGKGFNAQSCTIFQNNTDGTIGYYYQGAGAGISSFQLPSSCQLSGRITSGLSIVQFDHTLNSCTPVSQLYGTTTAMYTSGPDGLESITITYTPIVGNTTTRNGFMKLICSDMDYGPIEDSAGPYMGNDNLIGLYFRVPCAPTPMPTNHPTNTPQPTVSPTLPPLSIEMESGMIVGAIIAGSVIILMSIGLVVWLYKRHQTRIKTGKLAASWSLNDENY